jgi:hypothetical protein
MKQDWFYCKLCDMVCPQLSPEHHSGFCRCTGEETEMTLHSENETIIQSNQFYKELMEDVRRLNRA